MLPKLKDTVSDDDEDHGDPVSHFLQMLFILNGFSHGDSEHQQMEELISALKKQIVLWSDKGYESDPTSLVYACMETAR